MRYMYKIRPMDKEQEIIEAMSYKKMLKKLVSKYPKQIVMCFYKNKKGKYIEKQINTNYIKQKD